MQENNFWVWKCDLITQDKYNYQQAIFEDFPHRYDIFMNIGRPVNTEIPMLCFNCPKELINDSIYSNMGWVLLSNRVAGLIKSIEDVIAEFYPATIIEKESGNIYSGFLVVNFITYLSCINFDKSDVTSHPLDHNFISSIQKIVLKPEKIGNIKIFRLSESPTILVAHESIKIKIEEIGVKGISWVCVENYKSA
jgi:hypothetical protein